MTHNEVCESYASWSRLGEAVAFVKVEFAVASVIRKYNTMLGCEPDAVRQHVAEKIVTVMCYVLLRILIV